jgi:uncharacterized protein YcaQ
MLDARTMGWKYSHEWIVKHRKEVEQVLAHIREHSPARSSGFARTDGWRGGWRKCKPEKRALEMLFTAGELMIARALKGCAAWHKTPKVTLRRTNPLRLASLIRQSLKQH